jgi:hypothetical protein
MDLAALRSRWAILNLLMRIQEQMLIPVLRLRLGELLRLAAHWIGAAAHHHRVSSCGKARSLASEVISLAPSCRAVAPIRRSAGLQC